MYVKLALFHYRGFSFCFSLESSRIDWTCALCYGFPVHRGDYWDGAWSVSHPWSTVLPVVVGQVRTGRKSTIYLSPHYVSAHCTLTYPSLP